LFNDLKAFAFNYLRRVRSEHLSRQLDKQQPAQDNSCLAPIFLKIRTHALCPEKPPGSPELSLANFWSHKFLAPNVGRQKLFNDFPTFWSNHKFSFIAHLHFREICKPIWASRARLHLTATNFDAWIFEGLSSQSSRHKF
jgi:hypothetical protein